MFGVAERKGWFSSGKDEWHIGYLSAELAAEMVDEFVSKGTPIAAALDSIFEGETGYLGFNIIVLAPPGNSAGARKKREAKEAEKE